MGCEAALARRHGARGVAGAEESELVAIGYGTDPLVEAFWTRRYSLYPFIAEKVDLVLAPNYSMYGSQRVEHLMNFRRNLLVAAEMVKAGIPAVPNICSVSQGRPRSLHRGLPGRQAGGSGDRPQTQRTKRNWEVMVLPGLTYLSINLDKSIKLLFNGTIALTASPT